ncbi:NFACT RNA binding domain-containing protein [Telluribacter sp. SYSU D00476]|uniref:NFACT RNA binding domain-containing protein n=1 Tax=Telluribacter sp. SYSU D00476 TaxID=2811430 RepID=UPI001FF68E56|nr:NFACT RNA binding domain-containing protein [Telluribacter sp. SYSU D00476]
MHQNYYFLRQLAPRLHEEIRGKRFMEAFSQEKDEIIMVFAEARGKLNYYKPFFIKASLRSDFASLTFPDQFDRARRNSVDLFTDLYDQPVTGVKSYLNERALGIELEGGDTLVFKLFGNRSNIIHFDTTGQAVDLFNNKLVADQQIQLSQLTRPLDQTFEAYEQQGGRHEALYPTFGKEVNAYLKEQLADLAEPRERWTVIQQVVHELESPTGYYLTILNYTPFLSLLPMGEIRDTYTDPLEALNRFYYAHVRMSNIEREKGEMVRLLRKRIQQTERYLENNFQKLIELEEGGRNEQMGHILMANLHLVPERAERVELYDFYRDQPITIKLKKDLTPQKNAEMYYRKAKNEKIELAKLQESSEAREQELQQLRAHLEAIEGIEQLRELRAYIKKHGLKQTTNAPVQGDLFKKVEYQGYTILVGRNAKNNDLLTRQYAYKEDLWLHARDVSGSHVVIKYQAGKNFPAPVIERAAQLAAWYSRRRTDTLCPVIVTPKKFVRKPKGLAEGAVIVDKEEVVLVEPRGE